MVRLRNILIIVALAAVIIGAAVTRHNLTREDLNLVHVLGVTTCGSARTDTTLQCVLDSIGSAEQALLLTPETWTIANSRMIPANVTLQVPPGARLSINAGATLTINGPFPARPAQVFTGAGNVKFGTRTAEVYAAWFGLACDGTTNDAPAIQKAVAALPNAGTAVVNLGSGLPSEVCGVSSEVVITRDFTRLVGLGHGTTLRALGTNQHVVRWSASEGGVENLQLHCGSQGNNNVGLGVRPTAAGEGGTTAVHQNFNTFRNLWVRFCTDALVMKTGPRAVDGADSGNWYNRFYDVHLLNSTRGLYLTKSPTSGSSVNRNQFYSLRVAAHGDGSMNTGIHIECGDTNSFFGVAFEGIQSGTSPSATPTGIVAPDLCPVANPPPGGHNANSGNRLFAPTFEAVTLPGNTGTELMVFGAVGPGLSLASLSSHGQRYHGFSLHLPTASNMLALGGPVAATTNPAGDYVAAILAPNSDFGVPLLMRADTTGRGLSLVSSNFDKNTNLGRHLHLGPDEIYTTSSGTSQTDYLPVRLGIRPTNGPTCTTLGAPNAGSSTYCLDCRPTNWPTDPTCACGGTGSRADRQANKWICYPN